MNFRRIQRVFLILQGVRGIMVSAEQGDPERCPSVYEVRKSSIFLEILHDIGFRGCAVSNREALSSLTTGFLIFRHYSQPGSWSWFFSVVLFGFALLTRGRESRERGMSARFRYNVCDVDGIWERATTKCGEGARVRDSRAGRI